MKGRILVVDDEKAFRSFLRCVFNLEGYAVETARNGREGLFLATHREYDLIITDMMMPDLDGAGLIARLRNDGIEVPIIVITAYAPFEVKLDDAKRNRIEYVLKKPFSSKAIRLAAEQAMKSVPESVDIAGERTSILPFGNAGM